MKSFTLTVAVAAMLFAVSLDASEHGSPASLHRTVSTGSINSSPPHRGHSRSLSHSTSDSDDEIDIQDSGLLATPPLSPKRPNTPASPGLKNINAVPPNSIRSAVFGHPDLLQQCQRESYLEITGNEPPSGYFAQLQDLNFSGASNGCKLIITNLAKTLEDCTPKCQRMHMPNACIAGCKKALTIKAQQH